MLTIWPIFLMFFNLAYTMLRSSFKNTKAFFPMTIIRLLSLIAVIVIEAVILKTAIDGAATLAWVLIVCCGVLILQTVLDIIVYALENPRKSQKTKLELEQTSNLPWRTKEK